jgi:hypothetical protein
MPRLAVADLMVDLALPDGPDWTYDVHGSLVGVDPVGHWRLEVSGLVIAPRDGAPAELGLELVERDAAQFGLTVRRSASGVSWLRVPPDGPEAVHQHWKAALGNRLLVATLSSEGPGAAREELFQRVEASLETVQSLVPAAVGGPSDAPQSLPLAGSQELWFATRRRDLSELLARMLPEKVTDSLPSAEVLDDLWSTWLAGAPSGEEADHMVNILGVALGDHLVRARAFAWSIVSDEWGTALGVVAEGEAGGHVATDPFSFVAKRWERKEPRFLAEGIRAICRHVDEVLGAEDV